MKNKHEIEKIAFELYQRDGCMHGRELDHWLEAERIFHSRHDGCGDTVCIKEGCLFRNGQEER